MKNKRSAGRISFQPRLEYYEGEGHIPGSKNDDINITVSDKADLETNNVINIHEHQTSFNENSDYESTECREIRRTRVSDESSKNSIKYKWVLIMNYAWTKYRSIWNIMVHLRKIKLWSLPMRMDQTC